MMSSEFAGEPSGRGGGFAAALPALEKLFPFYCLLDGDARITSLGPSLPKVVGDDACGKHFNELFVADSTRGSITAELLSRSTGQLFVASSQNGVRLRGQVLADPLADQFLIAWSPWISSTEDFESSGFSMLDFGVQDPTLDMLHLLQAYERAQKEAEEPLQRLRRFFAASPDLMMMMSPTGQIRQANTACEQILGASETRLIQSRFQDWVSPASVPDLDDALRQAQRGVDVHDVEIVVRSGRRGDRSLHLSVTADVVSGLIFATGRDVSELSDALKTSARILNSAANAMLVVDENGAITYANTRAREVFGYDQQELLGSPVEMLVPDQSRSGHGAKRALLQHSGYRELGHVMGRGREVLGRKKDGNNLPLQVALTELAINGESHTLASILDLSAQRQLEQDLLAARDAAVSLAQAKTDLLANTSHEIRTPLASIIGLTELVQDTDLTGEQQEMISTIRAAGDRLLALVDNILVFAKSDADKYLVERVAFSPSELVENCVQILSPVAAVGGLSLITQVAESTPPLVTGDREKLRTVLLNLAGNAIKFTDRGSVTIELSYSADEILTVGIKDTGIGIEESRIQAMFRPFEQADSSTTRRFGGSGLGLAISRGLVALMDGRVSATSILGQGAHFVAQLPMPRAVDTETAAGVGVVVDASGLEGMRVLLVEDDEVNARLIGRMLTKLGAVVEFAGNGEQAIEKVDSARFAAVLMDCQMPVMDGFEATRRMRSGEVSSERLPIIALTASAMEEDRGRCLAAGMDDCLFKPLRSADLLDMLRQYRKAGSDS